MARRRRMKKRAPAPATRIKTAPAALPAATAVVPLDDKLAEPPPPLIADPDAVLLGDAPVERDDVAVAVVDVVADAPLPPLLEAALADAVPPAVLETLLLAAASCVPLLLTEAALVAEAVEDGVFAELPLTGEPDSDEVAVRVIDAVEVSVLLAPIVTLAVGAAVTLAVADGEGGVTQERSVTKPCSPRPSVAPLP